MEDDDDAFLYGDEPVNVLAIAPLDEPVKGPVLSTGADSVTAQTEAQTLDEANALIDREDNEEEEDYEEDSDSDIEIILDSELPSRSRDFRPSAAALRPTLTQTPSNPPPRPFNTTTEYIPRVRGVPLTSTPAVAPAVPAPTEAPPVAFENESNQFNLNEDVPQPHDDTRMPEQPAYDSNLTDPSTLPVARAASTSPQIDLDEPGNFSGQAIYEVDIQSLADKNWRRPGSDISDWFNYGFDEISWEAYTVRRRDMAEMAAELKANVINMAGMPEEMLQNAVPSDMRSMFIAQSVRMMPQHQQMNQQFNNTNGGFPMQMYPGMDTNMSMPPEMMGMSMPAHIGGMAPNGMQIGGPMGAYMPPGMDGSGTPLQNGMAAGPSGSSSQQLPFSPVPQSMIVQAPYEPEPDTQSQSQDESNMTLISQAVQQHVPQTTAISTEQFPSPLISGVPVGPGMRGGFRGGLGRGGAARAFGGGVPLGPSGNRSVQAVPKRPASPLPPNVPTGPRNQQARYKDKDRDGAATQVDGLDYGGGGGGGSTSGSVAATDEKDRRDRDSERADKHRDRGDRDRDRDRSRPPREERVRDRDKDREREEPPRERKKEKTPPSAPRKDKEKEERDRKKREEKEKRSTRETKDDRAPRKRTHSEDHEEESERRSSKRR